MASSRGTSGDRLGLADCASAGYAPLAEPVALDAADCAGWLHRHGFSL